MHLPEPNARAHRRRSLLPHAKRLEENRTFDILDVPLPTCSRLSESPGKAAEKGKVGNGTGEGNQGQKEGGEQERFRKKSPRKLRTGGQTSSPTKRSSPLDIVQESTSLPVPPERTPTQERSSVPPRTPGPEHTLPHFSRRRTRCSLTEKGDIHPKPQTRPLQPLPSLSLNAKQIIDGLLRYGIFGNDVSEEEVGQILGTGGKEEDRQGSLADDSEVELVECLDECTMEG